MTPYENCLLAIERLLLAVDVKYWPDSIRLDIQDWQSFRDTSHHLSTYGGMGSFNDIWICRDNSHHVTEAQEPWVNSLFDRFRDVAFYLAKHANDNVSAQELENNVGRYDSVFGAFVGRDNVGSNARGRIADQSVRLQGWRCFQCYHSEVTDRDLERYIAENLLPQLVFEACEKQKLTDLVDAILSLQIPRLETISAELQTTVISSGITFLTREGWMRPCPSCGGQDTGVFRWKLRVEDSACFEPSDDNAPMIERITG